MRSLSRADRVVAVVIAVICVLMMSGVRAIFAAPVSDPATDGNAHAYIP
jgi:hypothetical protein